MKAKYWLIINCVVLLSLLLTACGGAATVAVPTSAPAEPAKTEAPAEPVKTEAPTVAPVETEAPAAPAEAVEIKYFGPAYGPESEEFMKGVADGFNKEFEGKIHVSLSSVEEEAFKTKLLIDLRSSEPPDTFFQWEGGKALATVNAGYVESLDKYYEKFGWDKILNSGARAIAVYNDQKYLVGWNMAAMVFYYNKDLFTANNIAVPKTFDEMITAAETLKAAGVAPFLMDNLNKWPPQFLHQNILVHKYGLDVWNQLANNEIPFTDERVVDSLAVLDDWTKKGYFLEGINAMDTGTAVVPWNEQKAAMWFQGTWMTKYFLDDSYKFTEFFLFPEMDPAIGQIPQTFCDYTIMIHANSPHKDEAAEFVNYLINPENQTAFMKAKLGIATNVNADYSVLNPLTTGIAKAVGEIEVGSYMALDQWFDPSISNEYLDAIQAMFAGAMTPAEAMAMAEEAAVAFRGPVP
jgi:raffinose/stachyose/melibiose transport system substrate-binding protein